MSTIVIIDDSTTNRAIYSKLAGSLGSAVRAISFSDATEALAWLDGNRADLIVTDYKMPGMDGAALIRRVRAGVGDSDIPVIVVTAYTDRAFRMRALAAGATDFLLSPVDHAEFVARARNLLRMYAQQRQTKSRAEALQTTLERTQLAHQAMMRNSREALTQVIDTVPALISAVDAEGKVLFVNDSLARFAATMRDDAVSVDVASLLGSVYAEASLALNQVVFETGQPLAAREEVVIGPDGEQRTLLTTRTPFRADPGQAEDGMPDSVLVTSLDITERKQVERRLQHLAHHDMLTDLPNRARILIQLRHALATGRRGDRQFALLFIDLDRFKAINDGLGHHVGDQLLVLVGQRLSETVGSGNIVGRLGGDEFAIIQSDMSGEAEAAELAERTIEVLSRPFRMDGQELTIGASIGITVSPRDGGDANGLLRNADLAMYRAKARGRNTFCFFAADMGPDALKAVLMEADLRTAMAQGEFVLHYQPQVDLATGRIVGAEALLRWQRPRHGLVQPAAFLALAEESGLILPISAWVLQEACSQARRWQRSGLPPLRMAVNLSPVQFRRQDVHGLIATTLRDTGLDPALLELELTEGMLMEDAPGSIEVLHRLRRLGVGLSVDDFGTGYSSLSYVKNFPLTRLKIDQSFTRGLDSDPSDAAIVRTVLDLGHTLQLNVLAEGVETREQLRYLQAEGCDEAQGFLFSEALEPDAFVALMRRGAIMPRETVPG